MQEWINLVKEWVQAQGYLTAGFVNRGDPTVHDFTQATLIQDNAWHELDLSAIVPENAKGVCIYIEAIHASATKTIMLRKSGNVNETVLSRLRTLVAGLAHYKDATVACDENRKIDYWIQTPNWTLINFTVKSWWF